MMEEDRTVWLPIRVTPLRWRRLMNATRMLPHKPRVLIPEATLERFLDSTTDGVELWARRQARRRR